VVDGYLREALGMSAAAAATRIKEAQSEGLIDVEHDRGGRASGCVPVDRWIGDPRRRS
jgi:hypothetical protein